MRALLDDDGFDFRFEIGVADLSSSLELSDRFRIIQSLSTHYTVIQMKAQIDQIIEGLHVLGVYDLIQSNPRMMKDLLTTIPKPLTIDEIMCFDVRFSPESSNRREDEELIWMYWMNYLELIHGESIKRLHIASYHHLVAVTLK